MIEVVVQLYAIHRPLKLKCLPRLDPHTTIQSTSVSCYCQSKSRIRWTSYWQLANTSLDPLEY